jgi:hypothetical protein
MKPDPKETLGASVKKQFEAQVDRLGLKKDLPPIKLAIPDQTTKTDEQLAEENQAFYLEFAKAEGGCWAHYPKHDHIYTEIVRLTASMAKELMKHNRRNRPPTKKQIAKYVRDILDGNWGITNETIGIDKGGLLFDGQHRLQSLIDAEEELIKVGTLPMMLVFSWILESHAVLITKQICCMARKIFLAQQLVSMLWFVP